MFNNYNFKLEWNEIDQELRDEKISEYLAKEYDELSDEENEKESLEEYQERNYLNAEREIEAHFPIYF